MPSYQVICTNVLEWAREYREKIDRGEVEPFHALFSDCPWHLRGGFMGRYWDHDGPNAISFQAETWATLAEVLHPGAFLMVFAGSRGWHRLACAMEDAGLVLQPSIFVWGLGVVEVPLMYGWLNAQSFPKASNISRAIDKAAGVEQGIELKSIAYPDSDCWGVPNRNVALGKTMFQDGSRKMAGGLVERRVAVTDLARAWEGHRYGGQVLKDALTPIICAQKPWTNPRLDCIVKTGAGAINVDAGRVGIGRYVPGGGRSWGTTEGVHNGWKRPAHANYSENKLPHTKGRWPSNFCLVHCAPGSDGEGGCVRAGTKRVSGSRIEKSCEYQGDAGMFGNEGDRPARGIGDPDGYERVDAWQCEEGCPARKLGEMSGSCGAHGGDGGAGAIWGGASVGGQEHGDKGTAARFYHQAGWEHERMESSGTNDENYDQAGGTNKEGEFDEGHCPPIPVDGGCARPIGSDEMQCARDPETGEPICPVAKLDEQAGERVTHATGENPQMGNIGYGSDRGKATFEGYEGSKGGASRFYAQADWTAEIAERLATEDPVRYCPKAAKRERSSGLDDFFWRKDKASPTGFVRIDQDEWEALGEEEQRVKAETGKRVSLRASGNIHVALKPIALCKWLASLLLPPKEYAPRQIVIPFCGSFSEGIGAILAGWEEVVGIDFIQDYCDIAESRINFWRAKSRLEMAQLEMVI